MSKALYFIHDQLMGVVDVPSLVYESHAFFCASCGDIWARIIVDGRLSYCHQVPCENHLPQFAAEWTDVPGSLIRYLPQVPVMDWARDIQVLPIGVLHWEFKVHNAALQRQQHEEMQDA